MLYFFSPTDLFFSLKSEDLHFLHRSALSGFLAPHLRQTCRKSLLFWAICFFVASAMGILETCYEGALQVATISFRGRGWPYRRLSATKVGTWEGVRATFTPAEVRALIFESAVP